MKTILTYMALKQCTAYSWLTRLLVSRKNKYQTRNSQNSQNVALLSFFLSLAGIAQYFSCFGSCAKQQYLIGSSALAHFFFHNFKLFS